MPKKRRPSSTCSESQVSIPSHSTQTDSAASPESSALSIETIGSDPGQRLDRFRLADGGADSARMETQEEDKGQAIGHERTNGGEEGSDLLKDGQSLADDLARLCEASSSLNRSQNSIDVLPSGGTLSDLPPETVSPLGEEIDRGSLNRDRRLESSVSDSRAGRMSMEAPTKSLRSERADGEHVESNVGIRESGDKQRSSRGVQSNRRLSSRQVKPLRYEEVQDNVAMEKPLSSEMNPAVLGAVADGGGPGDRMDNLKLELQQAREELRRLREKAAHQTQMYGTIGAQGRRLDQRAAELRERVSQAQQALDERAEKFRSELNRDRKRLRDYRDKLRMKAQLLTQASQLQKKKLADQKAKLERRKHELDALESKLEAQQRKQPDGEESESIAALEARIQTLEQQAASQQADLDAKEHALHDREGELQTLRRELEDSRLLRVEKQRVSEDELARRFEELETRETALKEWESRIEEESRQIEKLREDRESEKDAKRDAELAEKKSELDSQIKELALARSELADQKEMLDRREQQLAELSAQSNEATQRARSSESELETERERLAEMREAHEQESEALSSRAEDLDRRQEALDAERFDIQMDREKLDHDRQLLADEKTAIASDRAKIETERQALASERESLAETESSLNQDKARLESSREEMQSALARIERERLELQDRQRTLAEGYSQLETKLSEEEAARLTLRRHIQETNDLRSRLVRKVERHRQRKARLMKDMAELESRRARLDSERSRTSRQDADLQELRDQLDADRGALEVERRELERQQAELDDSRRTFEAGLRKLEEDGRDVSEREIKLAQRADQLEAYRNQLEQENADLQKQREAWLEVKENRQSSEQAAALLEQAKAREQQLQERERALRAHEEAMEARVAELADAESEVERQSERINERVKQIEAESESLEMQRNEIESVRASESAVQEEKWRQAEAEMEAERERLRQREREMDHLIAERREALEAEHLAQEQALVEQMRQRVTQELADRIAEVEKKEAEVEARCKRRAEAVQDDIEQRLSDFEVKIKQAREATEEELTKRRDVLEEELGQARALLDEQIEDLRRRQSEVAREQAAWRNHISETQADALKEAVDEHTIDDDLRAIESEECQGDAPILLTREDGGEEKDGDDSMIELVEECEDSSLEIRPAETPSIQDVTDPSPIQTTNPKKSAEPGPVTNPPQRTRFRPVLTAIWAVLVGGLLTGAMMLSFDHDAVVRGRWVLNTPDSQGAITPRQHVAAIIGTPEVFATAADETGIDFERLYQEGSLSISPSPTGDSVEINVRAPKGDWRDVQAGLAALGKSYESTLAHTAISEGRRERALAETQKKLATKKEEWSQARDRLAEMKSAVEKGVEESDLDSARAKLAAYQKKAKQAHAKADATKAAVKKFQSAAAPTGPVVPSEAQLQNAMAGDAELTQAIDERAAKAQEFYRVFAKAISELQTPLSGLTAGVDSFSQAVQDQLVKQSDPAIRKELEQVAADLADYRKYTEQYVREWDQLSPKVAAWKPGDDPDLLIEYQKKAELLVRSFHSNSKSALSRAIRKADAIGQSGTEMTQRRIVQNALARQSHNSFSAWKDWIDVAVRVVPANNPELHALRNALTNLAPRIQKRRLLHQSRLAAELGKQRAAQWESELERLKREAAEADRRQRELDRQTSAAMESVVAMGQTALKSAESRRDAIAMQQDKVSQLSEKVSRLTTEIERLRSKDQPSLAGEVRYEAMDPILPQRFNLRRRNMAVGVGGGFAMLFWGGIWLLSRSKTGKRQALRSAALGR